MSRVEGAGCFLWLPHFAGGIAKTEGRDSRPDGPSLRTRHIILEGAVTPRHGSLVPVDPNQYLAFKRPLRTGEPVAQVVEHETFNLGVEGSSPSGLTNKSKTYGKSVSK